MSFASLAGRGGGNSIIINPAAVVMIDDNGDGSCTMRLTVGRQADAGVTVSVAIAALGLTSISVIRSGNTAPTAVVTSNILAVEPWTNPRTNNPGAQLRLRDAAPIMTDTALATVLALLDPSLTISATRDGATTAGAITRAQVATVIPSLNRYSGVAESQITLRDGSTFIATALPTAILSALNA